MKREDFVNLFAEIQGVTKAEAAKAVTGFLATLEAATTDISESGEELQFTGYFTLKVKEREARTGRNPQTGAEIEIPASNAVSFKVGKKLKDAAN